MKRCGTPPKCFRAAVSLAASISVLLVFLAGCSASFKDILPAPKPPAAPPPSSPVPVAGQSGSVTISPTYVALAPGQTFQFTATVTGGGQVQWFVNGATGGSSSTGTVSASGLFTAPATVAQSENVTV